MGKWNLLVGIAIGYVIGAAAGRQKYDQLKTAVTQIANKPQVQKAAQKVDDVIADKAPALHDVAEAVAESVKPKSAPEPAGASS